MLVILSFENILKMHAHGPNLINVASKIYTSEEERASELITFSYPEHCPEVGSFGGGDPAPPSLWPPKLPAHARGPVTMGGGWDVDAQAEISAA